MKMAGVVMQQLGVWQNMDNIKSTKHRRVEVIYHVIYSKRDKPNATSLPIGDDFVHPYMVYESGFIQAKVMFW
jgi:hypothetical protein